MGKKEEAIDYLVSIIRTVQSDLNEALDAYQENPKCGLYSIEALIVPAIETIQFLDYYDEDNFIEQFTLWAEQIQEKYSVNDEMYAWYRETVQDALNELN